MKVIVAGSRSISTAAEVWPYIDMARAVWDITQIVSGGAMGVDTLAQDYAETREIPCRVFPAQWDKYGKSAGYRRNTQMADYADALLAIWDGKSRGTRHMIQAMKARGKPIIIVTEASAS